MHLPVPSHVHSTRVLWIGALPSTGLPGFLIVGLPDAACRESRDRVRAALLSCGLQWPNCKIVVNLAPSSLTR
ncbi:MAG: hypothetical protein K8R99_03650 [Actinomycetia bacterium]|nr:hypothetical protein [Actinomycetes bacterium]